MRPAATMRSEFTALWIRAANRDIPARTVADRRWPNGSAEPTDYWISNLPADTPIATLVRLAKIRWRIEHDYRELKTGVGLDHFEGRSWIGWHHHATGHRRPRLPDLATTHQPKSNWAGLTLYALLGKLQRFLALKALAVPEDVRP